MKSLFRHTGCGKMTEMLLSISESVPFIEFGTKRDVANMTEFTLSQFLHIRCYVSAISLLVFGICKISFESRKRAINYKFEVKENNLMVDRVEYVGQLLYLLRKKNTTRTSVGKDIVLWNCEYYKKRQIQSGREVCC
jgi:hypothetical protein